MEVDALAPLRLRIARCVGPAGAFRVDHVVLMLAVRVGNVAEQDARDFARLTVPVRFFALAPAQQKPLKNRSIMAVGVVRDDGIGQHDVAIRRVSGDVTHLQVPHGEPQRMLVRLPHPYHGIPALQELSLCGAVPQRLVVHRVQKRHIVVVVIFYDQRRRPVGDLLLIHAKHLFRELFYTVLPQKTSCIFRNTSYFGLSIDCSR